MLKREKCEVEKKVSFGIPFKFFYLIYCFCLMCTQNNALIDINKKVCKELFNEKDKICK